VPILTTFRQTPLAALLTSGTLLLSASDGGGTDGKFAKTCLGRGKLNMTPEENALYVKTHRHGYAKSGRN
jgi:hypothetical protein